MSQQQNTKAALPPEEDEIDLIALAKTIWGGRKIILKIALLFMSFGLFVALFSEKEYTASTTFVPQTTNGSGAISGGLSGLASLAGINLNNMGSDSGIPPALYNQIINSVPFEKQLLQTPLTIEGQAKPITYSDYYTNVYSPSLFGYLKKFTIGLPITIIKALKGNTNNAASSGVEGQPLLIVTDEENMLIKRLNNQLVLDVNDKDGYISISATLPEAIAAAQLAKQAQNLLQQYIIDFKIKKSAEQLKFIQGRFNEKEQAFKQIQQQLATFKDRNQNINTTIGKSKLVQLQGDYDLAYSVYTELAKQLETQQIQVKQDTPVFTVLQPVSVPIEKDKPRRIMIITIFTFLGGFIGIGIIFIKEFIKSVKSKWLRNE